MPEFVDHSPPGVCIFCRLVAREIPSSIVYEDEHTIAFMDLGQVTPGHVLVATKRHAATLLDLNPAECAAILQTCQKIATASTAAFSASSFTLLQANGKDGGQTVNHFHVHVVPRHADDGVGLIWPRKEPGAQVLEEYALKIRQHLNTP